MASTRKDFRRGNLEVLRHILGAVLPPKHVRTDFVDPQVFANLPIRVSGLPFDCDEELDFEWRFTELFDADKLDAVLEKCVGPGGAWLSWHTWANDFMDATYWVYILNYILNEQEGMEETFENETLRVIEHSRWKECGGMGKGFSNCFDNLGEYGGRPQTRTTWHTHDIYAASESNEAPLDQMCNDQFPHISCLLEHNAPMDERVTRSELICAVHLMKQRMRSSAWSGHAIFPVFVYRFNDTHARITQAHFDGQYLQLRQTKPIALTPKELSPNLKLLLRWIMAQPLQSPKCHEGLSADTEVTQEHCLPWQSPMKPLIHAW